MLGQGINPALGRIDYSPYAQGAVIGAQGLAQGITALGQSAATGVQNYLKNRLQNQILSSENEVLIAGLQQLQEMKVPGVAQSAPAGMDKLIRKHLDGGGLNLNDAMKLNSMLSTTLKTAQTTQNMQAQAVQRQLQEQAASYAAMLRQGAGQVPSSVSNEALAQFSPQARIAGEAAYLQSEQARANLGKTQADTAEASARAAKLGGGEPENGYGTPDAALAVSKRLAAGQTGVFPSFTVVQGRYFPSLRENPPSTFEPKDVQLAAESAQKRLDDFKSRFSTAIAGEQSAILVQEGIKKKVTTGFFRPLTTYLKRAANDVGIKMEGLDEEVLAQKGIKGMQATQVQILARGLGSMSNADREFFVASLPDITDPTKANQFFAELTIENAKLARQDQAYVRELERAGKGAAEINRLLDERIEGRSVAKSVYDRIFSGKTNVSANAGQFLN